MSLILTALMMETKCSSEMSVLTRGIRRHIPADGILHSYRREKLMSYNVQKYLTRDEHLHSEVGNTGIRTWKWYLGIMLTTECRRRSQS
jgi:hypothetical protein